VSHVIRADHRQRLLLPPDLNEWVAAEHPARFVRDLVESMDLKALGFTMRDGGEEGRPHYAPEMLLAVWLYGWMERIRSSRRLEKACLCDVAFLWLTGNHHPDHNTLWRFFRDNKKALRAAFKQIVRVAVKADLVGFALHALDGTKIKAASSMDTALHRTTLEAKLKKLDGIVDTSIAATEALEQEEDVSYAMPPAMQDGEARRNAIRKALVELDQEETRHLHRAEPAARVMKTRRGRELAYNAQAVVDHDSDMIVAIDVTGDENDHGQMVPMVFETLETTGRVAEQTVCDAGYFGGEQIASAQRHHLPVLVNLQAPAAKGEFAKDKFTYDRERDGYVCPRGAFLPLEMVAKPTTGKAYEMKVYRCTNTTCPVRDQCTKDERGRGIKRTPYEDAIDEQSAKQQRHEMRTLMGLRKEVVEHIFGIIKTVDGFTRFTVRGLVGVRAQWALACAAVNLRKLYAFWTANRWALPA
jgi:transposase